MTGTGTALFAFGFYLVVLDPLQAVAIVALRSVLVGLQGVWIMRAETLARPDRLLRFLVPVLIGVPVGVSLHSMIDAGMLRITIAAQIGISVFRRISDLVFRRLLIILTLLMGIGLMMSELV